MYDVRKDARITVTAISIGVIYMLTVMTEDVSNEDLVEVEFR